MTREQSFVALNAASGIAVMAVSVYLLSSLLPDPAGIASVADKLAYALKWNAFAAVPLFLMLASVGNARFLSEAIDPTAGKESPSMIVDGRVADNTVQQFLLFAIASTSLAASLPPERQTIVGAATITFVAMRLLFWIGYRIRPLYRAFGFAGTAYLNLGLLAASLWLALH